MVQLLALVQVHDDLAFHILTILLHINQLAFRKRRTYHKDGCLVGATVAVLDSCVLTPFRFCQFDINLAWWAHVEQRAEHFVEIY